MEGILTSYALRRWTVINWPKQLPWLYNCKLCLNTDWLVVHSLYVSLHISAWNRTTAALCVQPVYITVLRTYTVDTQATVAYPECHCQHNGHPCIVQQVRTLGLFLISVIFQVHFGLHCLEPSCQRNEVIVYENLIDVRMRPAAIALN